MQWNRHKEAKQTIKEIFQRLDRYRIIHYSCQSFNRVENGKSTIIAAIAIYLPQYDRTESFDIQSTAEYLNIEYKDINKNLEKIEKVLLKNFFEFIRKNTDQKYLHWNMRNSKYGFQALSNRYMALVHQKPEYEIPSDKCINIAAVLENYYGVGYVSDPKIKHLIEKNFNVRPGNLLYGEEEA
ncbi:hypothetical protein [Dialister pneumosintes]|uniref:Uncharacterized protein n=1 Tax=Dialister pneumosintes TaxID=39950 RepID=A0A1B3WDY5_9FIRM|nr:hypothetical protein [Dialister pneumosintes]AOH39182.1 hypothetical protein BCB69_03900 [Dialister pneumosintes]